MSNADSPEDAPAKAAPKRTPLYDRHLALGARVIDFGGWAMPVQYPTGILEEHRAVREAIGLFDVSHMGEVFFHGKDAVQTVQHLVTNDVTRLKDGEALYTCTCNEDGGIVDDCIVYREHQDEILIVVNASNIEKDFAHFRDHSVGAACAVENRSDEMALLAVQGPKAMALVSSLTGGRIPEKPFTFIRSSIEGIQAHIARTGYTGEDGVEIFLPSDQAGKLWDLLLSRGAEHGIKPIGLGARDTLRLEARLSLYGNDIDDAHNPIEAGLGWVVKGEGYLGQAAIERVKAEGPSRKLVGFKVVGRGIARHGYPIHRLEAGDQLGERVGEVTSGTVAPTVGGAIGMGYVPVALSEPGTRLAVDCRGKPAVVELVKGPFYKRPQG